MQIFEGKLASAETQAQQLIDENCKTKEALNEGVNSLIELGVQPRNNFKIGETVEQHQWRTR